MPRIKELKGKEIVKFLLKFGFEIKGQRGSHVKLQYRKQNKKYIIIIPNSKIQRGLANSIYKQILNLLEENEEEVKKFFFHK